MRNLSYCLLLVAGFGLATPGAGHAAPTWFVVSELPERIVYGDSYLVPIEDPDDIAHARALIEQGASIGRSIALARIERGPDGLNRNVLAPGKPPWSWHVAELVEFTDNTIEIYDGWPTFVEEDVEGWFDNTQGFVGFWSYTVTAEVGKPAEFRINPGLNDAWVDPAIPFQGMFVTVLPVVNLVFIAIFTYDAVRPPGDPVALFGAADHRWITGVGPIEGDRVIVDLELTRGGVFNSADPAPVQTPGYGTLDLVFQDCNNATAIYDFPGAGLQGSLTLTRVVAGDLLLCEVLTAP